MEAKISANAPFLQRQSAAVILSVVEGAGGWCWLLRHDWE